MLELLPLGGTGSVTQNMYLYQFEDEIVVVDCGIGFPDHYMPGVDILLPDITPLTKRLQAGGKLVALVLSHGHDDHIAATGYILPHLPPCPVYASPLTAAFAQDRMREFGIEPEFRILEDGKTYQLSDFWKLESLPVTHSVPDTKHLILTTPEGVVYHGTDFRLDPKPVDGRVSDLDRMRRLGDQGVLLALVDSLRVENTKALGSETDVGPVLAQEMTNVSGKVLVTLMSSHIHRIQQVVDAALSQGRKIVFVGRSVIQNVKAATKLQQLRVPKDALVDVHDIEDYPPHQLCLIVAGSQGQEGSSLIRAVSGDHADVHLSSDDKVIFSADVIPGNDIQYYGAIDELARRNIPVVYPAINAGLHQSGHATAPEQLEVVQALRPQWLMPIGGAPRHRRLFVDRVAAVAGIPADRVLLPESGEMIGVSEKKVMVASTYRLTPQTVDGKGIGDVGPQVLSDRRTLSEAGIIVIVIPRRGEALLLAQMQVISRGFVFMNQAEEVIDFIKHRVSQVVEDAAAPTKDSQLRIMIQKRLSRSLTKVINRQPLVLIEFLDVK